MVDFHDPVVELANFKTLVNLIHTFAGLYIWEFVSALDCEWSVIRGHRPYRWIIWIYSFTRVATLVAVTLVIVDFNSKASYSCQALITFDIIFSCLAYAAAELLIVFRIIAIWNKQKSSWRFRSVYGWSTVYCSYKPCCAQIIVSCAFDRLNLQYPSAAPLTDIYWLLLTAQRADQRTYQHQYPRYWCRLASHHARWLTSPTHPRGGVTFPGRPPVDTGYHLGFYCPVAGVMPVIFLCLNLNDSWSTMFLFPSLIATTVAATRMHRSLTDFVSRLPELTPGGLRGGSCPTLSTTQAPVLHISHKRVEVTVHSTSVQSPTETSSYTDTEGQVTFKPHELAWDWNVSDRRNCSSENRLRFLLHLSLTG